MAFSGIDQLIALSRDAAEAFDRDTEEVLNEAIDVILDKTENRALSQYVSHCRTEAKEAIRVFARCDPHDLTTVLACHGKIAEYSKVAEYVSERLGMLTGPDQDDDALTEDQVDDMVGEVDGEDTEDAGNGVGQPRHRHRRTRQP